MAASVLVIGATGHLGRFVVTSSVGLGHPTFAFVRPSALLHKGQLIDSFRASGVTILEGTVDDHASLIDAVQRADIVVSALGSGQYMDELKILSAIKQAGSIKRFVLFNYVATDSLSPGVEFVEPLKSVVATRRTVMDAVRESGVPFTVVLTYGFGSFYAASLGQLDCLSPPKDKILIAADGHHKAYMVAEEDIASYAIMAGDDPRAANKDVHLRLPLNHLSQNDMLSLWEVKLGKSLHKVYESEDEMLKPVQGTSSPSFTKALKHFTFAKGGHSIGGKELGSDGLDAVDLYPQYKYKTVDEYLDQFTV